MNDFTRPKVVISRCLGFEPCRYNGQMIRNDLVEALKPHVDFITPCPEMDIGLGVPRHPVRLIQIDDKLKFIQPSTGRKITKEMKAFCDEFLGELQDVDGFILKAKSPSCGIGTVKIYGDLENLANFKKGDGFFGKEVISRFKGKAIEDETRLLNIRIRDHFLKKIFTFAAFRKIKFKGDIKELIDFQARNKLLLMSYSQKELKNLGRIVASHKKRNLDLIFKDYQNHLELAFMKGPTYKSNINVLQHAFGYVSKKLSNQEKNFFLDSLEMYREDRTPLQSCISMLSSWIIRFDIEYLDMQSFFSPYPSELVIGFEQDRRRDYWG